MIKIRGESPLDYTLVGEIYQLAFGRDNEGNLVDSIRKSDRNIPELSLVAELDGTVVGHILFSYIDLVGAETWRMLSLAPIAVIPEFQNQGIGSALVQKGLEVAEAMGEFLVIVLGHPQFYPRFGFEPSVIYGIESPFPVPDEVFMVKWLKSCQGDYRGKVIYPSVFNEV
ncbi:MAG TPA: GNAT family N-acetyltransferase [Cyanobacteria bacterium UBA11149]|nr:GNAT family N-acetyltransferase [Cyanobacteria bacterium UBA11367]HBE59537.1 GNAT family N-acetyltransferase [Cyanobacteria bacterium UBA11366]HBK63865.1 GNAT family N-acetyltransferase [Cyanobacteria bacterium UBA11166]HBR75582.1 GNAT family N-acetyltransferase [Cyanobacteria bacterium UBA11159]HBS68577.1 GNAT family N-acetyltransferase [Cyanobacteria bacterium UBA11153]HBW87411.1 GNAT family N-acetyltransferase [Cyanobacteria bacterium UBA11149]HCA93489.1 GNAT family N-acetyltransferase 